MLVSVYRCNSNISEDGGASKNVSKLVQEFELGDCLGAGGFGEIIKAKRICDNNEFAIKMVKFESHLEDAGKYRKEANMLSQLNHSNIVRYYSSWIETAQIPLSEYDNFKSDSERSLSSEIQNLSNKGYISQDGANCDDECSDNDDGDDDDDDSQKQEISSTNLSSPYKEMKILCIQMELCKNHCLRTAIDNNLYLEETKLSKYFREICEGLSYIHKSNIVHRDLKPENIFLTSDDVIKIGDFGLSKQMVSDPENSKIGELPFASLSAVCGTSVYVAPELCDSSTKFTVKADIYSLGVTYFEMCSRPMTRMETYEIFPMSLRKLKSISFEINHKTKAPLIRSLLHRNWYERPTCEDILKILNSEKSMNEIKEIIQHNKKIPISQIRRFEKNLKQNSDQRIELTNFFMKTAIKIFELHGARNITMPTFLPAFNHCCDNLTTLLNVRGNSASISNTSRIAFAHYVVANNMQNLRRYSIGKVYEEAYWLPIEIQECAFDVIVSEADDFVNDGEIMYIAKQICDKVFTDGQSEVYFFINHGLIFSTILASCKLRNNEAVQFTNVMMNFTNKIISQKELLSALSRFKLKQELIDSILKISLPHKIGQAEKTFFANLKIKNKKLSEAFKQLKMIIENANKFGINLANIFLDPLFVNQKNCTGMMFRVVYKDKVIASGGRFDSLIRKCLSMHKKITSMRPKLSAAGISFNVDNILKLLNSCRDITRSTDVIIYSPKNKSMAIPLMVHLLSHDIKCNIITEILDTDFENKGFSIMIQLIDGHRCRIHRIKKSNNWVLLGMTTEDWNDNKLLSLIIAQFPIEIIG